MLSRSLTLLLLLVLCSSTIGAQEMSTIRKTPLLVERNRSSLNANRKKILATAVRGQAINGVFVLAPRTNLKILSQATFTRKETLHIAGNPMPKDVKRQFQARYVEVTGGEDAGKKGWIIASYLDPGDKAVHFLAEPPRRASSNNPKSGVDLTVGIYAGRDSPTGGQLLAISVANKGTETVKASFKVVVKIGGRTVKTELVRGPLKPDQAHSFDLQVRESDAKRRALLEVLVDPDNKLKETDETNNKARRKLSPIEDPSDPLNVPNT